MSKEMSWEGNNEISIVAKKVGVMLELKNKMYKFIKRAFDILCALIGCIFLLPIAIIVKIIFVATGDFGAIFYTQERVGQYGKKFNLYKFRTMAINSEEILQELLKDEERRKEWTENQKFSKDPRITKIGNILRKTSLDEVPQFINVMLNNMSIIGPRPLIEGELEGHGGDPEIYEKVKPGITGWWA